MRSNNFIISLCIQFPIVNESSICQYSNYSIQTLPTTKICVCDQRPYKLTAVRCLPFRLVNKISTIEICECNAGGNLLPFAYSSLFSEIKMKQSCSLIRSTHFIEVRLIQGHHLIIK